MHIHSLTTGHVRVRPNQVHGRGAGVRRRLNVLRDRDWTPPLPIHAWAIAHPEGLILVDTGEVHEATDPRYYPLHPYYRRALRMDVAVSDEIDRQLQRVGLSAEQVRWVVLTHLHTDHAGGVRHFPDAEVVVAADEWEAARGLAGRLRGYLPQLWPRWLTPRVVTFTGEPSGDFPRSYPLTEAGDVLLVPTPGHTHGHLSVLVHRSEQPSLLLAGDASYTQQLMLDGVVDGVAVDERTARETLARIRRHTRGHPTVYLPAHDPGSADRYASGETVPP